MKLHITVGIVGLFLASALFAHAETLPQVVLTATQTASSSDEATSAVTVATVSSPMVTQVGAYLVEEGSMGEVTIRWANTSSDVPWVFFDIKSHASETRAVYPFVESATTVSGMSRVKISGLTPGKTYYFRVGGSRSTFAFAASEFSYAIHYPQTEPCRLLNAPLGSGKANDTTEVIKLQQFLRYGEHLEVDMNGSFDQVTEAAVVAYQEKYKGEVLAPWNLSQGTGYVYITTLKKINSSFCGKTMTLTADELEIIRTGSTMHQLTVQNTTPSVGIGPLPGLDVVTPTTPTPASSVKATTSTTVKKANPVSSFFKRLFGRGSKATTTTPTATKK